MASQIVSIACLKIKISSRIGHNLPIQLDH
jgi:hypothetical protein